MGLEEFKYSSYLFLLFDKIIYYIKGYTVCQVKSIITNKIFSYRTSLTEMSVLLDILNVSSSKEKRYMVLDPVQQNAPDPKLAVQLMSKRRVRVYN